jgi:hypothetical protein
VGWVFQVTQLDGRRIDEVLARAIESVDESQNP